MSKRLSTEAKLLDWIDTAPIEVVTAIMGIATARWKARVRKEQPQPAATKRKSKTGTATAFPGTSEVKSA
jgi:hypothetical protein